MAVDHPRRTIRESARVKGRTQLRLLLLIKISCRRIKLAMASAFPCQQEYTLAHVRLARAAF